MSRSPEYYCKVFQSLNVSNKKGIALYQPILLLTIIDLISQNFIKSRQIYITDSLVITFYLYYNALSNSDYYSRGGLFNPFIYLQSHSSRFWKVEFVPDYDGRSIKSDAKLKRCVQHATIDENLFRYIKHPRSRSVLIDSLISAWFENSRREVESLLEINSRLDVISSEEFEVDDYDSSISSDFSIRRSPIREAFFRKSVIQIYDYKCALCCLKAHRSLTQNIVDGAHIRPYALFYDNRIINGISLCKNHHWAFDCGWFYVDEDYRIRVAENLDEDSPYTRPLAEFHGESIQLPDVPDYYPSPESLQWHFQHVFNA